MWPQVVWQKPRRGFDSPNNFFSEGLRSVVDQDSPHSVVEERTTVRSVGTVLCFVQFLQES